ncbi:extended synaptotagmin-2 isoform X2 [Nilaparvata lugens]|uniref:extended synaptotagmin-2 isoform X2 n=1 Tax=Nilaparvata lugens TaxID=108931 RepID=UPI00193D00F7|nr:extended synaptotagmin-2 isoform X2 [Nilaparvata lugens]
MMQLSCCKTTHNSAVLYRTDCPVYEQGFTFLVNNPETDTLHLKVIDQKTQQELGKLSYNLSALLDSELLELQDQPLQLYKAGPDTKVTLSLRLRILKSAEVKSEPVTLPRQTSVDSTKSQIITSVTQSTVEAAVNNRTDVSTGPSSVKKEAVEDMIVASTAPPKVESAPPSSTLHHRNVSTSLSAGESGLGRIQLTIGYSVQRQRLIIVVHKIANLPLKDPTNIPDPYVKLYLLPDRSKESKRKTEVKILNSLLINIHKLYVRI